MSLGAGTLAYGIVAGVAAATALVFTLIATQRRRGQRLYLAFGLFGIAVAVNTIVTVLLQKSESVEEYVDLLKPLGVTLLLVALATVMLLQAWTGAIPRGVMLAFLGASAVVAVLQLSLPEGLLAADITGLRDVHLFGEAFVVHEASSSPWRPALDLYLLAMVALVVTALWQGVRRGPRAEAVALAVGMSASFAIALTDNRVDEGVAPTPYLAPFGAVFVVIPAAWLLARRMAETERQLAEQTTQLEATVIDRTAELIDANRRLEAQVDEQRASARRLAALAEQFESVNALMLRHGDNGDLERSLLGVLANLGDLLEVDGVALRVTGIDPSIEVPTDIGWNATVNRNAGESNAFPTVEPIVIGSRRLGELVVQPLPGHQLGNIERRYIGLASDHLAGFLDRLELSDKIAATAVDTERQRIARELHDSVTQKLYSISFLADAVPNQLERDPEQASETVGRMRQLLLSSLAELRTLLFELQPEALDAVPLPKLMDQLAELFQTSSPVTIETLLDPVTPLATDVKAGIYRIAQEAISNAVRHSRSDVVSVELHEADETVEFAVRDHGVGFAPENAAGGYGLTNMRRRAASIGAELHIDSSPGVGTAVILQWPKLDDASGGRRTVHAVGDTR